MQYTTTLPNYYHYKEPFFTSIIFTSHALHQQLIPTIIQLLPPSLLNATTKYLATHLACVHHQNPPKNGTLHHHINTQPNTQPLSTTHHYSPPKIPLCLIIMHQWIIHITRCTWQWKHCRLQGIQWTPKRTSTLPPNYLGTQRTNLRVELFAMLLAIENTISLTIDSFIFTNS